MKKIEEFAQIFLSCGSGRKDVSFSTRQSERRFKVPTPPFTDQDVVDAFADYSVAVPALGCGSFKIAYRASLQGSSLVLKILNEPLAPDLEKVDSDDLPERFARELTGMSAVSSPHVVQLLRAPEVRVIASRAHIWYAEPHYPGGTLEDRLNSGRALPVSEVEKIVDCLLSAVEELWTAGRIVHRDIKPGNVVFDLNDQPVLLDLGIAYFSELSSLTDAMGISPRTPRYAAPEQFEMRRAATIDFRTDLFLIGILAFEMLTGRHPFWEPNVDFGDYWNRLTNFDASMLASVEGATNLKTLLPRLLAARPSGRYRTVRAARSALGRSA